MTPLRTWCVRGERHDALTRAGQLQGKDLLLFFGWSSSYPSFTFDSPPASAARGTTIASARGNRRLPSAILAPRTRARIAPAWGNGCLSPAVSAPIRARTAHARGGTSSSHRRSRRRGPGRGQRPLGGTAGSRRRSRLRGRWLRSHPRGGTASSRRRSQRRGPGRGNVAGFDAALLRKLQGEDLFLFFVF